MPIPFSPAQLVENTQDLSSLPEIYIRVSALLDDPEASNKNIGDLIQTDPALSGRLLKLANSPVYMSLQEITSISQAVAMMGRKSVRQLLLASVSNSVFARLHNDVLSFKEYWYHSLRTGVIAQQIYRLGDPDHEPDTLFSAGLLHDIGKLVIAQQLPDKARRIFMAEQDDPANRLQTEYDLLGFSHAEVGAALLQNWQLPTVLEQTVRWHHAPAKATDYEVEVWILALANIFAKIANISQPDILEKVLNALPGWEASGVNQLLLMEAMQEIEIQVEAVLQALQ